MTRTRWVTILLLADARERKRGGLFAIWRGIARSRGAVRAWGLKARAGGEAREPAVVGVASRVAVKVRVVQVPVSVVEG